MRSCYYILAAYSLILAFSGCQTDQPAAPIVDISPLSTQIGNLAQANADLRAANERLVVANTALLAENDRLKAQLRADADAGIAANKKGWLPFEGYVWRQQIARLPGVQSDEPTATKWKEAEGLYAAGGESAMQGVIKDLRADAEKANKTLGELQQSVEDLTKERDAAQKAAKLAQERVDMAAQELATAIDKARKDEAARIARETREWQIHMANWAGGGLFVVTLGLAACCFLLPVAGSIFKKSAFIAGIGCAACFALARFLSSPWFDVAWKITAGSLIVAGIGLAAWELRQAIKRSQAARKAADNAMVAERIIPVIDNYYKHVASPEAVKDMDKIGGLWDLLDDLGGAYDAAVKRIKADQAENTIAEIKASIALEKTIKT